MITIVCGDVFAHDEGIDDDSDDSDSTRSLLTIMLTESLCRWRGGLLVGGDLFAHDEKHDASFVVV